MLTDISSFWTVGVLQGNQGYQGTIVMKASEKMVPVHTGLMLALAVLGLVVELVEPVPVRVWRAAVQVLVDCPEVWLRHAQFPERLVLRATHSVSCSAHAVISHTTAGRRASEVTVRAICTCAVSGGPRCRPRHWLVQIATEQHPCAATGVGQ